MAGQLDSSRRVPGRPLWRNRAIGDQRQVAVDVGVTDEHPTREQIRGVTFERRRALDGMGASTSTKASASPAQAKNGLGRWRVMNPPSVVVRQRIRLPTRTRLPRV